MSHKGQISTVILGEKWQEHRDSTNCTVRWNKWIISWRYDLSVHYAVLYCFVYYQCHSDKNGSHLSIW